MMHMSFYFSDQIGELLFKNWNISSVGGKLKLTLKYQCINYIATRLNFP